MERVLQRRHDIGGGIGGSSLSYVATSCCRSQHICGEAHPGMEPNPAAHVCQTNPSQHLIM